MRYILDASVALKWFFAETNSSNARNLRDETRSGLHESVAPDFFPVEVAHAITRAQRQRRITEQEGSAFLATLYGDMPSLLESVAVLTRAHEISSSARIGVYDCVYIALAEHEGCDFVTADARLIANLSPQFPFIVDLSSLA